MTRPRKSGLRPGDTLDVVVEKGVYRGQGLARHEGQVVFVPRGLPGDRVRVRVESASPGFVRAALVQVLEAAPGRTLPPCPHAERCGGCAYQHYDYDAQLRLKESVVLDALRRAGAAWEGPLPVRASPREGWRMRAMLHVDADGPAVRLGLHEEGTHRVVDLERCLQLSEGMNRTARALKAALDERPALARRVSGVDLAESRDGRQLVAALETTLPPAEATMLAPLADTLPWLTGFGVRAGSGSRAVFVTLRGEPHVESRVAGFVFRSHVQSFFQGNRFLIEPLVQAVVEATPRGGPVLDLYAGVGLFALPLAARADRVTAVEAGPGAVEDARENVARGALGNVRLFAGEVAEALTHLPVEQDERIVLDPPRAGAGPDVVGMIARRRPLSVVYVSCDPPTLGRDLKAFAAAGYRPQAMEAFDLFPDTFHIETVARLSSRS